MASKIDMRTLVSFLAILVGIAIICWQGYRLHLSLEAERQAKHLQELRRQADSLKIEQKIRELDLNL